MKKLLALAIIGVTLPFATSAATLDELQAQLQTLMAQIEVLQQAQTGVVLGASNCPNLTRTLVLRSTGDDVMQLQKLLITHKYLAPGYDTGFFGSLTEAAVKRFQCEKMNICSGSPATNGYGVVGPKTSAAIANFCANAQTIQSTTPSLTQGPTQTPTPIPITQTAAATTSAIPTSTTVATTTTATQATATYTCKPPRYYYRKLSAAVPLQCSAYGTTIFSERIDDTGYALARVRLTFRNNAQATEGSGVSAGVYTWGGRVRVGNGDGHGGTGEATCPQTTSPSEQMIGYGYIDAANPYVKVEGHIVRDPCIDGRVTVFGGGVLEVWVEDPDPSCRGKDIAFSTTYAKPGFGTWVNPIYTDPLGIRVGWVWPNALTKISELLLPENSAVRSKVKVMAALEGSPRDTPPLTCGNQTATASTELKSSVNSLATTQQILPSAWHMGHFNLGMFSEFTSSVASSHTFQLFVNTTAPQGTDIFTGGCCGAANIGAVRE